MRILIALIAICCLAYADDSCTGCKLPDHFSIPSAGEVLFTKKTVDKCEVLDVTCEKVTEFSLGIRLAENEFSDNNDKQDTINCRNGKWYYKGKKNPVTEVTCHYVLH
ncbi:unnamed protein product [Auanema sp. JU1783]|nr:unnamed protein product [Auanema sp. JU1783]